ncbi:hypothetical protein TSOC_003228, partial [Tetrabaena socialis]
MGWGDVCPSAPELWRLGWSTPLATLNSGNMLSGKFSTFELPATYATASGNMLKIQPDWMGANYSRNVYLALRQRGGGDTNLLDEFVNKINIHDVEKNIDNSFTAMGDPRINFNIAVAANDVTVLDNCRLVVLTGGFSNGGGKIVVKVCRFSSSSSECVEPGLPGCSRPDFWCDPNNANNNANWELRQADCDGDGVMDWVCTDMNGQRGVIRSTSGCNSDYSSTGWPSAPTSYCPSEL